MGSEVFTEHSSFTSPLTTKGDVYVYSSADTRLPVGTNNQLLTADSTQTTGLKWTSPIVCVVKTADEGVTSSTVLQNDDELTFTTTSGQWAVIFVLYVDGATSGDIKIGTGFTIQGGHGILSSVSGTSGSIETISNNTQAYGLAGAGTKSTIIITGQTTGSLQLQWAQNSSNVTATTVYAGSFLIAVMKQP